MKDYYGYFSTGEYITIYERLPKGKEEVNYSKMGEFILERSVQWLLARLIVSTNYVHNIATLYKKNYTGEENCSFIMHKFKRKSYMKTYVNNSKMI